MKNSNYIKRLVLVSIVIISCFYPVKIYSQQAGTLDSSFGNNGVVYCETNFDQLSGPYFIMDNQERILSVSNDLGDTGFVVMRHTIDGLVDATFGNNGMAIFNPGIKCQCYCILADNNDRLLVAGYIQHIPDTLPFNYGDFFIARFQTNGSIDSTFGIQGYTSIDLGQNEGAAGLALQSDSLILLSGGSGYNIWGSGNTDVALIRLLPNGNLDSAFGTNGIVITDLTPTVGDQDFGGVLIVQLDGKILQTATNGPGINVTGQLCLLRYQYNGMPDPTFANNGIAIDTINVSYNANSKYIGIKNNGSIIVACNDGDVFGGGFFYAIRQYTSSGILDNSFAGNGIYESIHSGNGTSIIATQLQSDNKLIAFVNEFDTLTSSWQLLLTRLTSQGTIDSSFGSTGKTILSFNSLISNGTGHIYLYPNDKITLLGTVSNFSFDTIEIFIARFYNDIFNAIPNELFASNAVSLFPNPATDLLVISYPLLAGKDVTITISDITGKIIYTTNTINSEKSEVNTSDFAEGMYMVQVRTNDFTETKKVIVTK